MGKNKKTTTAKNNATQTQQKPVENKVDNKQETPEVPIAEAQVIDHNPMVSGMINEAMVAPPSGKSLSPDAAAMLAYTMQRKFFDDPKSRDRYPQTFLDNMSAVQDGLIVGTIIQEVVTTNSPLSLIIRKGSYNQLRAIASDYGVKLPEVNKLALPTKEELKAMEAFGITQTDDGQLKIPFTPEDVDDNTKKQIAHEEKIRKTEVEMDPKKITTDEQAAAALEKIYANRNIKGGIHVVLLNAIHFVKEYRFAEAERKNDQNMCCALESRTINDWLVDTISIKEPLLILKNVTAAMCRAVEKTEAPISAFLSFRSAITKDGVCPLSDTEIAAMVKALISWYVEFMCAEYNSQLTSSKKMTQKTKETVQEALETLKEVKKNLTEFDTETIEKMPDPTTAESDANTKMLYYFTRSQYFAKDCSGKKSPETYFTNLKYNVWNKIAEIANMFLTESNQIEDMGDQNILDLEIANQENNDEPGNEGTKEDTGETKKN